MSMTGNENQNEQDESMSEEDEGRSMQRDAEPGLDRSRGPSPNVTTVPRIKNN